MSLQKPDQPLHNFEENVLSLESFSERFLGSKVVKASVGKHGDMQ